MCVVLVFFFFFKQKTAYEMRISDWSSDVCSSDLSDRLDHAQALAAGRGNRLRSGPRSDVQLRAGAQDEPVRGRSGARRSGVGEEKSPAGKPRSDGERYDYAAHAQWIGRGPVHAIGVRHPREIGRASCRERVGQYV